MSHNRAKIFDEPMIEGGKLMKAMDLCDNSWDEPILDSFNLGLINLNSISRDNITTE